MSTTATQKITKIEIGSTTYELGVPDHSHSEYVSAEDLKPSEIKLSATIWTDKTIGYVDGTTTAPKVVAHQGETLETVFTNIFGTVTDDTTNLVNNPSITITSIGGSSYEYGTKLNSVTVNLSTSAGSYKYGPAVSGAGWNGGYSLNGTGFTSTSGSTNSSQTIGLSPTFTVGSSSAITLNAARNYNAAAATNYAKSKLGVETTQRIESGTATTAKTFNPTAKKYVYYAATDTNATPSESSWTLYDSGQTNVTDLTISAGAGKYVWIAATTNKNYMYAFNEVSEQYNAGANYVGTKVASDQSIVNSKGATVSGYCFYRTNNAKSASGSVKYKLDNT